MRILVCEDDEVLLRLIQFVLTEEKLGEVVTARNGHEALKKVQEQSFDLVITDIHMPFHKGEEILNLLRVERKSNTPIIMMSSDSDEDVRAHAKSQGVNEFLTKPIKPKELSKLVKKLLKL